MFIDFEGIDGSGKTTLSEMLLAKLKECGLNVQHTRAGGNWKSRLSGEIRKVTRNALNLPMSATAEMLLYVARDAQMVDEFIEPALADDVLVIADRYLYSYYSMCHYARGLDYKTVDHVCQSASKDIWPNLIIYIDVDLATSRWRKKIGKIHERRFNDSGRKGLSGLGLRHRMRDGFLQMAKEDPEKWVVVDNMHHSIAAVFDEIWRIVSTRLNKAGLLDGSYLPQGEPTDEDTGVTPPATWMIEQMNIIVNTEDKLKRDNLILEHFYSLITRFSERWPDLAASLLSGLDSGQDYQLREQLVNKSIEVVATSLTGLDSEASYKFRNKIKTTEPQYIARSLTNLNDPKAWALRQKLIEVVPADVIHSINGINSEATNKIRLDYLDRFPKEVLLSLKWIDSPVAWEIREKMFAIGKPKAEIAQSLTGLDTKRAWEMRDKLKNKVLPWVIDSLSQITSKQAWDLRWQYRDKAAKIVVGGMKLMDSDEAWKIREDRVEWTRKVLDNIVGMDSERAYQLREKARGYWDNTLVGSLFGISSEQAEKMRLELFKENPENLVLIKHLVEQIRFEKSEKLN